jgi:hypothetical protein
MMQTSRSRRCQGYHGRYLYLGCIPDETKLEPANPWLRRTVGALNCRVRSFSSFDRLGGAWVFFGCYS